MEKNFYNNGETQQAIALTYFNTNKLSYLLQILYFGH